MPDGPDVDHEVPEATDPPEQPEPPEPPESPAPMVRKARIELPPLPPEPAQPGPSGQGKRGSVDPQELERRLQDLAKPSESGKEDTSPKQLRFSNVEEIEPASQDPSFPELPHAVAAAAAATVTQDLADSREETRVQDGFPERSPRRHGARPIEVGKLPETMETSLHSVMEMDEEVARNIDDFFSRDEAWRQLARHCDLRSQELMTRIHELPVVSKASKFKVTVPKPYPGVQYRRSKHLEERYSRFAENGAIVVGQLEADSANGEWLRISGNIFLPVRVGQIHILDEVIDAPVSTGLPGPDQTAAEAWWTCCPSNAEADGKALEQAAHMRPEQHPR